MMTFRVCRLQASDGQLPCLQGSVTALDPPGGLTGDKVRTVADEHSMQLNLTVPAVL